MCTVEKRGRVYILTLTGAGDEHRLNPTLLTSIRSALAEIRAFAAASPGGAALVTAAEGKFFSNGLDTAWARSSPSDRPQLMSSLLRLALADLLSLPLPTVAAVTGHAAAAGCVLALSHDHVVMPRDRGVLYMSELDIGVPFANYFTALLRAKVGDRRALRDLLLRARKVTAAEGVEMGIVDRAIGGAEETLAAAVALGEELAGRDWDGMVYAAIRRQVFPEACANLGLKAMDDDEIRRVFTSKL